MKNKKSLFSLGLLALVLVLGVGYAVVSSIDLTIGGTATVKDANLRVDIASVVDVKSSEAQVSHSLNGTHATSDTFTITDMTLGEEVTMTYTIDSHETDVTATVAGATITNNNPTYYSATYTIEDNTVGIATSNDTATVVVTVKMIKTPVAEANESAEFNLKITATPNAN